MIYEGVRSRGMQLFFNQFQSQLEERDRLVRVLQQQMLRMAESHEPRSDDTVNVATQTDRVSILLLLP